MEPVLLVGCERDQLLAMRALCNQVRTVPPIVVVCVDHCGHMDEALRVAIEQHAERGDLILMRTRDSMFVQNANFPSMIVMDQIERDPPRKDWWNIKNRRKWSK